MPARYLIRFDDICPAMNWPVWTAVEKLLTDRNIRPIVAVVPDNVDPTLSVGPAAPDFWSRVRRWQGLGWTIGMHGYQHSYSSKDPGILKLNPFSEFAGLPYEIQLAKLKCSLEIFRSEHVVPQVWVAPGHSFDRQTLRALGQIGLTSVSDGFSLWPYEDVAGTFWVPQQLWTFRSFPAGIWTVCLHINGWNEKDIDLFGDELDRFRDRVVGFDELPGEFRGRRQSPLDQAFRLAYSGVRAIRRSTGRDG